MELSHSKSVIRGFLRGAVLLLLVSATFCPADTFTNQQTGEVLHGYKTSRTEGAEAFVQTQEKGLIKLNLAQWKVVIDHKGRNNKVVVMEITDSIMNEIETEAFEKAIVEIADEGPLFLLLEIDTPGGKVYLAQRICAAISGADNLQTIAYVKSGQNRGALSAGAAVSLAADKIYMAEDTVIGAATMVTSNAETMKKAYGEDIGEKLDSAWRAKLASLAERNNRSGILARAMVDRNIEVVEVIGGSDRLFIEPINKKADQKLVKTWSRKGSLLTLTASEAVGCGFAEAVANSREQVLSKENAAGAEVVINTDMQDAARELERARGQLFRIRKSVDLKMKESEKKMTAPQALRMLREARREFKQLINLARRYPDLELDMIELENSFNSVEASYKDLQSEVSQRRRQRRY